jgi:hypothetical protein
VGDVDETLGADWLRRLTSGAPPPAPTVAGSARVSGRSGGRATAVGGTIPSCRSGASIGGSVAAADDAGEPAGATSGGAAAAGTDETAERSVRRCTGGGTSEAPEVSAGTVWTGAATIPAGAIGETSWPSGSTIGGSGWAPGTASRNVVAGATSGGSPTARWIGGRAAQAPVGRATGGDTAAPTDTVSGPPPARSGSAAGSSVERLNGHGRRTVTPPQTGAC